MSKEYSIEVLKKMARACAFLSHDEGVNDHVADGLLWAVKNMEELKARAEKAEKNFWFDLANVCIKAVNDLEYQAEIGEELVIIPRYVWDKSMDEIIKPKEGK